VRRLIILLAALAVLAAGIVAAIVMYDATRSALMVGLVGVVQFGPQLILSPTSGKWADIAVLEPVRDYKARHASTMLTFDAVVDAIGQIEARAKQPA